MCSGICGTVENHSYDSYADWIIRVVIEEFSSDSIFELERFLYLHAREREEMMEMWFYYTPVCIGWFYSPQNTSWHDGH